MIILGLDISTSNVGYTLIESDESPVKRGSPRIHRIVKSNSITIGKVSGLWSKSAYTRDILIKECKGYKIDAVVVEEALKSFTKRRSSAGVLALLGRFNGIISFICRDTFGCPIHFVGSTTARKKVGIKIDKEKDTKEQIFAWAREQSVMKDYKWPTKVLKSGARKGQTIYEPNCYDISDSLVMAIWACDNLNIDDLDDTIC